MAMTVVYTTVNGQVLSENRGGVVHHFVPDPLGSVVMVRDTSGNTVYEAEYAPYGDVQSETGTNPSEFGYVGTLGYVKDSASSLYVRARYLFTNLGRWLTKDPLWPSEAGYVYASAAPGMWVDPSGLKDDCDACCKKWEDAGAPPEGIGENLLGATVCCPGKTLCGCVVGKGKKENEFIKKCILEHERVHFKHVNCPGCDSPFAPDWKKPPDGNQNECTAYQAEVRCLDKACSKQAGDTKRQCEKRMADLCYFANGMCKSAGTVVGKDVQQICSKWRWS